MLMNFTEAIRKSNLAKQEVLKTRENILKTKTTAEDIKTALVEQGINIADVSFDDIAQFIRENNIGANDSWERPKEWLALPKVVAEESKYTDKAAVSPQSLDDNKVVAQDLSMFQQYLSDMTNLSEISTGMQDGVFNVSVNDFAYEMLCKVEENSDNLLLFEGASLIKSEPFTNLSSYEQSNFLTDLFIQIDDEEPLNLTRLAKGEINLPTEGKYKNIAIINQETLTEGGGAIPGAVSAQEVTIKGIVLDNIGAAVRENNCYPLSLLISLDYNCFDDNVKMKNGDKQCIIKIWGNGFIRLTPYRSFLFSPYSVLNLIENIPALVKVNDCILDVSICDSDIDAAFYMMYDTGNLTDKLPTVQPYLPITLECLLIGFGDFTKKITFASSLKPEFFMKLPCMKSFIFPPAVNIFNRDNLSSSIGYDMTSLNDFNFYMNIKEIDCSNVRYYNDYTSMMFFLLSTSDAPILNIHSMAGKVKNVENIIFPNFKADIQDNNHCVMVDVNGFSSNILIASSIIPYCFNLSAFKALKREAVVDLINKLPSLDVDINNETIANAKYILPVSSGTEGNNLDVNNDSKEIKDNTNNSLASISSDSFLSIQKIDNIVGISEDKQCFNGNQELVNEYLLKYYSLDSNINNSLAIRINKESSLEEDIFLDKKWFHSVLVSPFTFKQLTNEDIQLAADKGWRIVNGVNYPVALLPSWNEE